MKNSTKFKFYKSPLFWIGCVLIVFTFCDIFNIFSLTTKIGVNKEQFYLFLHLLFVIAIFVFQEINQKRIFEKLNENVSQISPLRKIEEINTTVQKWLKEDQANILIFYFPYSIHPGFWYDTGNEFTTFINNFNASSNKCYKKLYFIGPDADNSPFSKSIEMLQTKLTDEFVNDFISKNGLFYNLFNFKSFNFDKKELWIKLIVDEYTAKLKELERKSVGYNSNLKVFKIGANDNCKLKSFDELPSFSFILKVNKNKAEDMIVIDTFNAISESNLTDFINDLGINSINIKEDPQKLITAPQIRIVNNQHTANLFLTTFLETCCYNGKAA